MRRRYWKDRELLAAGVEAAEGALAVGDVAAEGIALVADAVASGDLRGNHLGGEDGAPRVLVVAPFPHLPVEQVLQPRREILRADVGGNLAELLEAVDEVLRVRVVLEALRLGHQAEHLVRLAVEALVAGGAVSTPCRRIPPGRLPSPSLAR